MFSKASGRTSKSNELDNSSRNVIAAGTVCKGDIQSDGNIRIDGTVIGTLNCKGKVVVGESGIIEGEVVCLSANISGDVKVKIVVSELLTLNSTAKLVGEIVAGKLEVEPGAIFSGTCSMGAVIKEMSRGEKQENKQHAKERTA